MTILMLLTLIIYIMFNNQAENKYFGLGLQYLVSIGLNYYLGIRQLTVSEGFIASAERLM